jgi:hypothetical protein
MPHAPESFTSSELDVHRIEYFRAVADYAEMVVRGADLSALCEGAPYVQSPVLALMVPRLSSSPGMLSSTDFEELPQRLADESRPVRTILAQLVARNCLVRDVLRCVANYHDEDIAEFWAVLLAA